MLLSRNTSLSAQAGSPAMRCKSHQAMKVVCTASQHQEIHFDRRQLAAVAIGSLLLPASSAQARKAKAPPGPEEVVKSVIAGREAGKEEEVLSNMAKTVVWRTPKAYPNDPLGGEFKGRYGVLTYLARWNGAVSGMKATNVKIMKGDGPNQVIVQSKLTGVVKATGKKFSLATTEVYRVATDGSGILNIYTNYDTAAFAKAAGIKLERA